MEESDKTKQNGTAEATTAITTATTATTTTRSTTTTTTTTTPQLPAIPTLVLPADNLLIDDDIDLDHVPLPVPDSPGFFADDRSAIQNEGDLEIDDGEGDERDNNNDDDNDDNMVDPDGRSLYPVVPVRYRVERLDAATINSSSRSLYDDDLDYVVENGRRYCGDDYFCPNDELEQDRLRVLHQVFLHVFDFHLTTVPLGAPSSSPSTTLPPRYILDIGAGTGEWAIGMGEEFPGCEVVGVDISAMQPTAVPHNVFFEIDDCEIDWMRPDDSVDLVHLRNMAGAFSDWDFVYQQARACLRPGSGYIEVVDFHDHITSSSFYSAFPPTSPVHAFASALDEAALRAGRRRGVHHMDVHRLQRAGFVDVQVVEHSIAMTDPTQSSVSKLWLITCLHSVEAVSLRLLTRYLGWSAQRVFSMCEQVCAEIKARALDPTTAGDLTMHLQVLTARKPGVEEMVGNRLSTTGLELPPLPEFDDQESTSSTIGPGRV